MREANEENNEIKEEKKWEKERRRRKTMGFWRETRIKKRIIIEGK